MSKLRRCRVARWVAVSASLLLAAACHAIGWDSNDFIVIGGYGVQVKIAVFSETLAFKGYMVPNALNAFGMEFDQNGNLVVAGTFPYQTSVYDPGGNLVGGFNQPTGNGTLQSGRVTIASNGNHILSSNGANAGLQEFTPGGSLVRSFGNRDYSDGQFMPGGRLWAGDYTRNFIDVFDFASAQPLGTIQLNPPGGRATAMQYRSDTNTIFCSDGDGGNVVEYDLNGNFIRDFQIPIINARASDFTYWPNGDLYVTTNFSNDNKAIAHFAPDGTYLGRTSVVNFFGGYGVGGIIWTGLAPEPSLIGMFAIAGGIGMMKRRRSSSDAEKGRGKGENENGETRKR